MQEQIRTLNSQIKIYTAHPESEIKGKKQMQTTEARTGDLGRV